MDWKQVIGKLAPTVASALLGPLAGGAVAAIGEIFGISEPTQEKIQSLIESGQMTGEQIAALKMLELRLKAEEQERGFRYADLEVRDRESARERDAKLALAGKRNVRADLMAGLAVLMICAMVWLVWKDPTLPDDIKGIVTLVLGRFLGYLDNIYNYEFGATRISARQTELLAKAPAVKE